MLGISRGGHPLGMHREMDDIHNVICRERERDRRYIRCVHARTHVRERDSHHVRCMYSRVYTSYLTAPLPTLLYLYHLLYSYCRPINQGTVAGVGVGVGVGISCVKWDYRQVITDGRTDERAGQGTRTPGIGTELAYGGGSQVMSPPKKKKFCLLFSVFCFLFSVSVSCFGRYC